MPPPRKPAGVVFPTNEKGDRSTTDAQKKIWAATFNAIDSPVAADVQKEKKFRYAYDKYVIKHVRESLVSPMNATEAAKAGLDALHNSFEFIRDDQTMTLAEAMKQYKGSFETGFVKGEGKRPEKFEFEVPYKGKTLRKDALIKQLNKWRDYGTIEPSAADAIAQVANNPGWTDLSDQYFVLLGAGSAMGPLLVLLALGANVIAVDLNRPNIWKRLIGLARESCGTMTFPLRKKESEINGDDDLFANAGCDLIQEVPEINNWLQTVYPEKDLIIGCYVYLDGEAHVRVVLACDAIMKGMCESRKSAIAFLCTPTDCHVIPEEARKAAQKNYSSMGLKNLVLMPIKLIGGKKYLVKNVQPTQKSQDGKTYSYVDGLVVAQGPNYALAKRMQHWRSIVAREQGCVVSTNVAPSTATASVVHNKQFAWAYDGMPYFRPLEIFQQETSNAVMAALLIHDIRNKNSISQPNRKLSNPLELFSENSFHGGIWRCGYTVGSIGEVSVLVHFVKVLKFFFILVPLLVVVAAVYFAMF
mmetsp:Transcript_25792/g.32913  ORF Transcript_25792/g.32913 Transcript_25792/m.32913 type:complete len:529 (-) Transcript_25792:33-1619(-)|eukprot:CAMPEP_0206194598 /NCGR_PEP_ID=MMETSP0166-20121206/7302_1 /ASSEMBLY_ACC=CAM_ASM_000260 /TAXON_ID=95228 /ORGANISM="Vannella robusta, Strain DIVA3 518/3/11/1/6" /LENGTH=528 /DNA_ID=CAMNT_0053611621 /DNA_START=29 /DNA_END=1615 /DNA_ORIENTATION=+